ncbi:MAG: nucleotide exchange factor GrpE [Planctomycetota bacterium]
MHEDKKKPGQEPDFSDEVETASQLMDRVAQIETELAEANAKYLRLAADYQNSQRRSLQNESHARAEGAARVISGILTVVDHFDLALNVDPEKATVKQVVGGVQVIRDELMKTLLTHGVGLIAPKPGDEFQPGRHEAVLQQAADGVGPGLVASCFQAGYTLTVSGVERVVRPAKVAVTPGA